MTSELYQLINVLEKLSSRLSIEMVTAQETLERKAAVVCLQNNQKLLMSIIQAIDDPHVDIEAMLSNMYECLESILRDLDSIHELIVFSAQRHIDYEDKKKE